MLGKFTRTLLPTILTMALLPVACTTPDPRPATTETAALDVSLEATGTPIEHGESDAEKAADHTTAEPGTDAPSADPAPETQAAETPEPAEPPADRTAEQADATEQAPPAPRPTEPEATPESEAPEPTAAASTPVMETAGTTQAPKAPAQGAQREASPAVAPATETQPAAQANPEPVMDLEGLESRLRQTKAIGLFTKLELKSQVGDLLDDVEDYHRSRNNLKLSQLEEHFNLLVMKLLVLLEKDDPQLQHDIARARPVLWTTLADPEQFSTLKGP